MRPRSTHTLFCDETGSTGSRFLDPAQPVFAEGGWFIAHEDRPRATAAVEEIEKRCSPSARELKGSELVKRPAGRAMMRDVCRAMGKAGGIPYIYIVEKKYAVCSKIVEEFLDPAYNPKVSNLETWDPEGRQETAQAFYDTFSPLIEAFAEAYRIKDPLTMRQNAEGWVRELKAHNLKDLADRVAAVLPSIEGEVAAEAECAKSLSSGFDSLNMPVVVCVLQFAEQKCPYRCDIVHDQNASFEQVYRYVYDLYANARPRRARMLDGREIHFGFRNVLSLSFADSQKEPLIRAADYTLAGARKFIQLALADEQIPEDTTHVTFSILGALLVHALTLMHPTIGESPELGTVMASRQWTGKVFGRLAKELERVL